FDMRLWRLTGTVFGWTSALGGVLSGVACDPCTDVLRYHQADLSDWCRANVGCVYEPSARCPNIRYCDSAVSEGNGFQLMFPVAAVEAEVQSAVPLNVLQLDFSLPQGSTPLSVMVLADGVEVCQEQVVGGFNR